MANSTKQSPLGINVLGSLLSSTGLTINTVSASYMGVSKTNTDYTFGKIVSDTVLRLLTWSINDGYLRGPGNSNATLTDATYNNLISIGSTSIPALGNSKPATYDAIDPTGQWTAAGTPATTGYSISGNTDQGQAASWLPYNTTNANKSVTQWGYLRLHALQAWNEFNWNGVSPSSTTPSYKDFCGSYMTATGFINYINKAVYASHNASSFMDGVYSNMDDLTSADISGISLSSKAFGSDLENLGKAISLSKIDSFGLPSVLLELIGKSSAVTQDLALLLLASGLSSAEINNFTAGVGPRPSVDQERKIYGAFLLITGQNLAAVLAPLQCNIQGLDTLADLLNIRKMFPNSYASLTVPMYNGTSGLPTNSKTYYLIYTDGGVNIALTTPMMNEYVGEQIPSGTPPISNSSLSPENYVTLPTGFGSYLKGIIPDDQATAAGAFQFTMRQVNRINQVDIKKFAKVAKGIESMDGLTLITGTSKPTDQTAIDTCKNILALGSGPYGAYTVSDMFGCMSGLPYSWKLLYDRINQLQNTKLSNIYQQLFLATTWEGAVLAYTLANSSPSNYYIDSLSIVTPGGGHGRGTAPAPTITLPFGATATCTIGTDPTDITTFGRLTGVTLGSGGSHSNDTGWYANIQCPPTATLPVSVSGEVSISGTNTASGTTGWNSPMNDVVQAYIDQANSTIQDIATANPNSTRHVNAYWNILGSQLTIEQRTRYFGIPAVSLLARDNTLNSYPTTFITFVDSTSTYAQDTMPHMAAQTLEAISDMNIVGGQSIIGTMRQERNQARLSNAGIVLDNNIVDRISDMDQKTLTTNGTLAGAGVNNSINGYTNPAWASVQINGIDVAPVPTGVYIPTDTALIGTYVPTSSITSGDITPILDGNPNATVSTNVPTGPSPDETPIDAIVIIQPPSQLDPTNVPLNLDPNYIGGTLMPASPSVRDAIDKVIFCNCDCWT